MKTKQQIQQDWRAKAKATSSFVSIRAPNDVIAKIDALCQAHALPRTTVILTLLRDSLDAPSPVEMLRRKAS